MHRWQGADLCEHQRTPRARRMLAQHRRGRPLTLQQDHPQGAPMPIFAEQSREDMRRFYIEVWRKHKERAILEPLEAQIAAVITEHPEYIALLESGEDALHEEFSPEAGGMNPFAHMALHQVIRDQVATDRPPGVTLQFRRVLKKLGDRHEAEHAMAAVLAQMIWESVHHQRNPDMELYLEQLRRL
jgi:hypothetical protein